MTHRETVTGNERKSRGTIIQTLVGFVGSWDSEGRMDSLGHEGNLRLLKGNRGHWAGRGKVL